MEFVSIHIAHGNARIKINEWKEEKKTICSTSFRWIFPSTTFIILSTQHWHPDSCSCLFDLSNTYQWFYSIDRCDLCQETVRHRVSFRPWCIQLTIYRHFLCNPYPKWLLAPDNIALPHMVSSWMWCQLYAPNQNLIFLMYNLISQQYWMASNPVRRKKKREKNSNEKNKWMELMMV